MTTPASPPRPATAPPPAPPASGGRPRLPRVTELRLSAFAGHRGAGLPLGALTLLAGPSGSGKTTALRAYEALARLGGGAELGEAFPEPGACVPERARADAQRRGLPHRLYGRRPRGAGPAGGRRTGRTRAADRGGSG
ncbi:hypothetical protein GCM10023238_06950 [Streptomyces heliomycini]